MGEKNLEKNYLARIDELEKKFSKAELELKLWLISSSDERLNFLLDTLKDFMNNDADTNAWFREVYDKQDKLSLKGRSDAAILLIHELREYSGHSLNFFSEKPHYEETLTKAHKRLAKQFKKQFPEIAPVQFREQSIAEILMGEALEKLTDEEIEAALEGADINPTKANKRKILLESLGSGGLIALSKIVGKKLIKNLVLNVTEKYLIKAMGEKAVRALLANVGKKIPQKAFKAFLGYAGWALLLKDLHDIGGEATRCTTPIIVSISIYRTLDLIENEAG